MVTPVIAVAFGLPTIKSGGTVLLGGDVVRSSAGKFVPFVPWFNFIAGFARVITGVGIWKRKRRAAWLAVAIAAATAITLAEFGVHVYAGGFRATDGDYHEPAYTDLDIHRSMFVEGNVS